METRLQSLEIRPDFDRDPSGEKLRQLLLAQSGHFHALARRRFLARLAALAGIPGWCYVAGVGPVAVRIAGLLLFPSFLFGLIVSVVAERWWSRRLSEAERALVVRRNPA